MEGTGPNPSAVWQNTIAVVMTIDTGVGETTPPDLEPDKYGFGRCQKNATCPNANCQL